ncbi:MAG TPA: 2-phospho-L-lactate transferase [Acidimicrobiales bacterium]|nr:2-phospho-L-lactate transferase [Acidimicrobiales bacterium]
MITALAGGVGAARLLAGLVAVVDPAAVTAVVNTGDDTAIHGLAVSPDLDTVTYTLAGVVNPETGWGRRDETWSAMEELRALSGRLAWFNLGDRDLGTHLYRTARLAEGAPLSVVTGEVAARWNIAVRLLPMSDDPVATRVTVAGGEEIGFQDYFVARRHSVAVSSVRFAGAGSAAPAPGVLEAIAQADTVVICPSNPVVSIGPVLAVPGIADAVAARRQRAVAVSPIVAGRALKGPADRLLAELGHEPSVVGVARLWAPVAATLVVDTADADRAAEVEAAGMRCVVAPSVMTGPAEAARLATTVLEAAG